MISLIVLFIIVIIIVILYKNSDSAIMKKVLIVVPIFILVVTIFFGKVKSELRNGIPYGNTETLEKILNISLENAYYVESYGKIKNVTPEELQSQKLKKYKTSHIGSTAHSRYVIYDKDKNVIATMIDIGNRNLIEINGVLYQIQE